MKFKKVLAVFLVMAFTLTFMAACSSKQEAAKAPAPAQEAAKAPAPEQKHITIGGGSSGGVAFTEMAGIATMVEKYVPGVIATAEVTTATIENCRRVGAKEMEFGFATLDGAYEAYNGLGSFDKKPITNLRYVLKGSESAMQIITLAKSNIRSIKDVKGKKIGVLSGITAQGDWPKVLEIYGISKNDYKETALTHQELADQLKDGIIDAYVVFAGLPVTSITDLATSTQIRVIPFEEDMIKKFNEKYPYFLAGKIPKGTYKGQDADVPTILRAAGMIAHADVDEELVYQVVKTVYEHNQELVAIHPDFKNWGLENAGKFCLIPPHPGLEKYLQEKGIAIDKRY